MSGFESHRSYSADVAIDLLINGKSLPVAQLGPDFLMLEAVADHPPCDAVVKLRVDNVEQQWSVCLPKGISPTSRRVTLAIFDTSQG
jgi:hypothetical protein